MNTTMYVQVKTTVAGLHNWPGAPPHRAYLATPHRHLFYFELAVQVFQHDREIEFHDLLYWLRREIRGIGEWVEESQLYDFGSKSCEKIASLLLMAASRRFAASSDRLMHIKVSEDNEVGSIVYMGSQLGYVKPDNDDIIDYTYT